MRTLPVAVIRRIDARQPAFLAPRLYVEKHQQQRRRAQRDHAPVQQRPSNAPGSARYDRVAHKPVGPPRRASPRLSGAAGRKVPASANTPRSSTGRQPRSAPARRRSARRQRSGQIERPSGSSGAAPQRSRPICDHIPLAALVLPPGSGRDGSDINARCFLQWKARFHSITPTALAPRSHAAGCYS